MSGDDLAGCVDVILLFATWAVIGVVCLLARRMEATRCDCSTGSGTAKT